MESCENHGSVFGAGGVKAGLRWFPGVNWVVPGWSSCFSGFGSVFEASGAHWVLPACGLRQSGSVTGVFCVPGVRWLRVKLCGSAWCAGDSVVKSARTPNNARINGGLFKEEIRICAGNAGNAGHVHVLTYTYT